MIDSFKASVQYGDWEGTVSADDADAGSGDVRDLLRRNNQIAEDELVVSVEAWIGENQGGHVQPPTIHAFVVKSKDFDSFKASLGDGPIKARRVEIENLTLEQFIALFKRFSISLCLKGLDLVGREYEIDG